MKSRQLTGNRIALLIALAFAWAAIHPLLPRHSGFSDAAAAIGGLRQIDSGERAYASSCAAGGFAVDLADLAKTAGDGGRYVPESFAANGAVQWHYAFRVERNAAPRVESIGSAAQTCNGASRQPATGYFASADPVTPGLPGRHFAVDERGILFESSGPIPNPLRRSWRVREVNPADRPAFQLSEDWPDLVELAAVAGLMLIPCLFAVALAPWSSAPRALVGMVVTGFAVTGSVPGADAATNRFDIPIALVLFGVTVLLALAALAGVVRGAIGFTARSHK